MTRSAQSEMGGLTSLSLFGATEMGGSAPVQVLKPTGADYPPGYGDALTATPDVHSAVNKLVTADAPQLGTSHRR